MSRPLSSQAGKFFEVAAVLWKLPASCHDRNLYLCFPQHLHFVFRKDELRQTAIQTYRKLRPHPYDGLVQTFEPRKMKRNFGALSWGQPQLKTADAAACA